ncbi:nitrate- and nitrite sensing domain-containing protein [Streptomyces sp. NBC_00536]|uniref:sensor histidine kinase n=1 Tax=Streptomyces sp. NBC_00536 TaxID=2975769 RepID=UPI002E80D55B|nr:nitrate- and nitrite sensing domain-containing protein [Streptomyces sp. NBC_00536]WUC77676.1 nitrate- and nitrite sensing domain-containing protein [Streptomyces sp. NBC_00536]
MRRPRRKPDAAAPRHPAPPARGRRAHAGPPADEPRPGPRDTPPARRQGRAPGPAPAPGQAYAPGARSSLPRPEHAPAQGPAPAAFAVGPAFAGAPAPGGPGPTAYGHGTSGFAAAAAATTGPAPFVRRGSRSARAGTVRAKVVSLLMVPVVSLLALWAFATVSTAQDIARIARAQQLDDRIRTPVDRAIAALQAERATAVRFLADPAAADQAAALQEQGRKTGAAIDGLRLGDAHTVADSGGYPAELAGRMRAFVAAADALGTARTGLTDRKTAPDAAYASYTRVVDSALAVGGALSGGQDAEPGADARVLLEFGRAAELLSREDALLALPGPRSAETLRQLTGGIETRRILTDAAARDLPAAQRAAWQTVAKSAVYADLTAAEDRALAAGTGRDAHGAPTGWEPAYAGVSDSMRAIASAAHAGSTDHTAPLAQGLLSPSGAAVLLGLAAVAAALVISVRIGRGLVVELVSLRNGALEIAHRKLPHAMDRLRAGEDIDVLAEAPPGRPAEDEIAQVGEALSTVHRAALSAAVERAELASGISGVFVNLARRSQVLVHKQLTLLDSMERRADDPGELGDLFRLDHLTTRMRRHAESLIILSGAAPGRAWRMPVPLTNVVRAAVSEIEDYPRVEVRGLAEAGVIGGAVADLTHLLAELIENAAQFSPPHTKVRVSGEPVGAGYVLEIEDRGLGMGRGSLADANRRIEQSESLDLFDSDRLGLFVVSRLSARHGVKVHLRTSPYGGTTAVVLMPNALLQGALTAGDDTDGGSIERAGEDAGTPGEEAGTPAGGEGTPGGGVAVSSAAAQADQPEAAAVPPALPGFPAFPASPSPRPEPAAPAAPAVERDPRPAPVATLRPARDPAREPVHGPEPVLAGVTELPRRVRQASLVPQLREAPAAKAPPGPGTPQDPPGRSPEEARDRMAAYRDGWARGAQDITSTANEGAE